MRDRSSTNILSLGLLQHSATKENGDKLFIGWKKLGERGSEKVALVTDTNVWSVIVDSTHNQCERITQSLGQQFFKQHKKMLVIDNFIDRDKSSNKVEVGHKEISV